MRILMLDWGAFGQEYMAEALESEGCLIERAEWPFGESNMRENEELCSQLMQRLRQRNYHFVFSFNFFPVAAKACEQCGTRYVSWVYDTPYLLLYSKHIYYSTNQIYFFDRSLWTEFRKKGLKNVYYLPLAAPAEYYERLTAGTGDQEPFESEISFVGSTYSGDRQNFYKYLSEIDSYTAGYLEAIMKAQKNTYGIFVLEELLKPDIVAKLQRVCPIEKGEDEWESFAWIYANFFLARKLTGEQRIEILKLLSEEHQVKLYSMDEVPELTKVEKCGGAEYETQMPLVFHQSKINLNMTLRSIHSGIPLRAMDIMGSGGFLLTNYQEDFLEFFEPGVDYAYYEDNADLLEKVDYYLSHEEERQAIARNGFEKIKTAHTYGHRARTILAQIKEK